MTRLNRVLVTTDLSAPARHAAERAALLSRESGAQLTLLHVANFTPLEPFRQHSPETADVMQQHALSTARTRLQELASALQQRFGVAVHTRVMAGSLLAELHRAGDSLAPDLIVCGATGESFLRHHLLGSTAERLLSGAPCPILVVRQTPRVPYRKLLVPVDFSAASLRAIRHAQAVAPAAEIVLLHSFEVPFESYLRYASVDSTIIDRYRLAARQESMRKLQALGAEAGLSDSNGRLLVVQGDPWTQIIEQEQELDCDLIVMGRQGHGALEKWLIGSVTKKVLHGAQCDVLISI